MKHPPHEQIDLAVRRLRACAPEWGRVFHDGVLVWAEAEINSGRYGRVFDPVALAYMVDPCLIWAHVPQECRSCVS